MNKPGVAACLALRDSLNQQLQAVEEEMWVRWAKFAYLLNETNKLMTKGTSHGGEGYSFCTNRPEWLRLEDECVKFNFTWGTVGMDYGYDRVLACSVPVEVFDMEDPVATGVWIRDFLAGEDDKKKREREAAERQRKQGEIERAQATLVRYGVGLDLNNLPEHLKPKPGEMPRLRKED